METVLMLFGLSISALSAATLLWSAGGLESVRAIPVHAASRRRGG